MPGAASGQFHKFKPEHDCDALAENTGDFGGDTHPVVMVLWKEAKAFADGLTAREGGRPYRLPTEAEWERAARAGTMGPWYWGEDRPAARRYANLADLSLKAREPAIHDYLDVHDGWAYTAPWADSCQTASACTT